METLLQRVKLALVGQILNVKEDMLDKAYLSSSAGTFTRRELAKEIEEETEIGKKHLEMIFKLTLDLVQRNKETLK